MTIVKGSVRLGRSSNSRPFGVKEEMAVLGLWEISHRDMARWRKSSRRLNQTG